jgi:hypothetical protein
MKAREQKAALAETVRLTGIAPHDGETLCEYLQRIANSHPDVFVEWSPWSSGESRARSPSSGRAMAARSWPRRATKRKREATGSRWRRSSRGSIRTARCRSEHCGEADRRRLADAGGRRSLDCPRPSPELSEDGPLGDRRRRQARISRKSAAIAVSRAAIAAMRLAWFQCSPISGIPNWFLISDFRKKTSFFVLYVPIAELDC